MIRSGDIQEPPKTIYIQDTFTLDKCYWMVPNWADAEWYQMTLHGTKWCRILLNVTKCYRIMPNPTQCCQMLPNGNKECRLQQIVPNGAKWCHIVRITHVLLLPQVLVSYSQSSTNSLRILHLLYSLLELEILAASPIWRLSAVL